MTETGYTEGCLLPYEWPGTYFIDEEEKQAVRAVLDARSPYRYFGHAVQGYANRVEDFFCQRLGRKHAVAVNSGSAALTVAMSAAGIGPGHEVLLPGYFWVACASAIVRCGAIPRLVEVDNTFTMDPADVSQKINKRTKAVLMVHMSGTTGHLDAIISICQKHNLTLIEDVAQANGATYKGKPLGSFGQLAIFSFQQNKNITGGEGGLVVCDSDELGQRIWAYQEQGYPKGPDGSANTQADFKTWGYCSHMSELTAALVWAQAQKLDTIVGKMRSINNYFYQKMQEVPGAQVRHRPDPDGDSGPFLLISWPNQNFCQKIITQTRNRGVKPGPLGASNICMHNWGLHVYYHNTALVSKHGVNPQNRPWSDAENAFHSTIHYHKGTLPQTDALIARSSLICTPPALTQKVVDQVVEIFKQEAQKIYETI